MLPYAMFPYESYYLEKRQYYLETLAFKDLAENDPMLSLHKTLCAIVGYISGMWIMC